MKLWGGRFGKATDGLVDDFHSSISFDQRLFEQDITGSIAHATMLGEEGIIPAADAEKIVAGLKGILEDARAGKIEWMVDAEDIHMNVETLLTERIGEAGKRLHTGRSRNDQVALDTRMYAKVACRETESMLDELLEALLAIAQDNLHTIMPGYTHMQKAQPITLAHHMMAYVQMFLRDRNRFRNAYKAADVMVLGSGALAGTTYPLNRERVAEILGFSRISENSLDGVADRDYMLDYLSAAAICMMHLSRFCEELILWNTNEFRFVEMDDGFATGSSIMPQKKNPDVAELIRGKTGRVYGHLMGLLTVMKGLPLAYNKDGVYRHAEDRDLPQGRDGARRFRRVYERDGLRGLPGEEGRGLPRRPQGGRRTGGALPERKQGPAGPDAGGTEAVPPRLRAGRVRRSEHDRLRGKKKDPRRTGAGDGAAGD